jgi:dihydrofolate reductase
VVVTRQTGWQEAGVQAAASLPDALALCNASAEVWIIGGAQIYAQAEPQAQRVEVTEIAKVFDGDAFAPALGAHWRETARNKQVSSTGLEFSFVTYQNDKYNN